MSQRLHLFGIRHHGPGSAASVLSALDELRPDAVLIEGPSDANDILEFAARPGLVPPIAILVHESDAPEKAVFYPFAAFSPEWQALRWALKNRKTRALHRPACFKPGRRCRRTDQNAPTR